MLGRGRHKFRGVRRGAALEPAWSQRDAGSGAASALSRHTPWNRLRRSPLREKNRLPSLITPVGPNEICIALIGSRAGLRFADLPTMFSRTWPGGLAGATTDRLDARGRSPCPPAVAPRDPRGCSRLSEILPDRSSTDHRDTSFLLAFHGRQRFWPRLCRKRPHDIPGGHQRISRMPRLMSRLMLGLGGRAGMRRRALARAVLPAAHVQPAIGGHVGALHKPSQPHCTSSCFVPAAAGGEWGWVARLSY